jgi:3-hydroxyisobutyrate dehydrogenase
LGIQVVSPGQTRVGWVGTGVMGRSMCGHLLADGYQVVLSTRTRAKAEELLQRGAAWADTPAAVAERSDVVFTMLGYPSDVRQVVLGEAGLLEGSREGTILVDMTTSEPSLAVEIAEAARPLGVRVLDAPVSGGDVGAQRGELSIMVGGEPEVLDAVRPCLELMGRTVVHQGGHGAGQHTKLVNQTLIAGNIVAVCEALLYGYRAGLNLEDVLRSVSTGAAGSWTLSNLGPRMLAGDYAPGFYVEHFLKDLRMALAEAERMHLALPGLALAHQLYVALEAQGHAKSGTQALVLALASLAGVDWRPT